MRGDYQYVGGDRYSDLPGVAASLLRRQGAYDLVSTRVGVRTHDWEVSVYATNLFDTKGVLGTVMRSPTYQTITAPRTVGLNIIKAFK